MTVTHGDIPVDFCFRVTKEAGVSYYTKDGQEPAEAYIKAQLNLGHAPSEELYAELHKDTQIFVAGKIGVPVETVIPITFQEYMDRDGSEGHGAH
jgi:hypothetical protein